ncbi:cyclic GMP-AMP synthase-like [Lithobates pipiens]
MGGRGRGKEPDTKQSRGRGRAAPKSNEELGRGRGAAKCNGEPGRGRGAAKCNGEPGRGRGAAKCNGEPPGRGRGAAKCNGEPGRGRGAAKCNGEPAKCNGEPGRGRGAAKCNGEPGRGRGAAKCNGEPGRGKAEVAGRSQGQSSTKKEPVRRAEQNADPGGREPDQANPKGKVQPLAAHNGRGLRPVVERLRLKMNDISGAAMKVNPIVDTIIHKVSQEDPLFSYMERMSTGSYYEKVKISRPNEFDIMLKIPICDDQRISLTEFGGSGAFYTLCCKRNMAYFMDKYVDDDRNISAKIILTQFRKLVKEAISGMPVSIKRRNPSSPAVTLIIKNRPTNIEVDLVIALEIRQSWPAKTRDGMNIGSWLGTKVKRDFKFLPFFMVPKQCNEGNTVKDTWRISFSHIEKEIMTNHGSSKTCCEAEGNKCCRKKCLKLLKHLLELLKNDGRQGRKLDKFCSYYAKTALLHLCAEHPRDEEWKLEDLDMCFNRYIQFFLSCLADACLPNFFIPSHNLFNQDSVKCNLLHDLIVDEIKHGYPLFNL